MKKQLVSLAASSAAVLGLVASGAGATTAFASGPTGNTRCMNVAPNNEGIIVQCVGQINGNDITIDISNINVLNNNQINILNVDIDQVLNNDKILSDIQIQVNKVAVDVVAVLLNDLQIQVCQVKVIELGVVNTNIAKCSL